MNKNKKYNTQEVCEIFDISKATLFRWESEGQITNVMRDWRNWRIYSDDNLAEIKNIIKSKGKR